MDHYYLVHLFGFFFGAIAIRDAYFVFFWSSYIELIEITFQHIRPNFGECWWDHFIMDIILSNTPGLLLGIWLVRKLGVKEHDIFGRRNKKSFKDWEIWHCHRRFLHFWVAILGISI